jgi:hypothetical protein
MKEVCDAVQSGRLVEMFGTGEFVLFFFSPAFVTELTFWLA